MIAFSRYLRIIALTSVAVILATSASGQVLSNLSVQDTCSYFGETVPSRVATFRSTEEAVQVIDDIVSASGLVRNFDVRSAGVPNAAAVIRSSTRFILYNENFMSQMRQQIGNEWAAISIMAHEVGHHLNGHTLDNIGSRPDRELEADYFSGFVLQQMGASLDDAQAAMIELGSDRGSSTHPPKLDRLAAIASGWSRACERNPNCRGGNDTTRRTPPTPSRSDPPERQRNAGPNSCEYAYDGDCDEPDLCDRGTDTEDCKGSRSTQPRPQQSQATNICQTPFMWCQIWQSGPIGAPCWCNTPQGPLNGQLVPR